MAKSIYAITRKKDGATWSMLKNLNKNRALHLMILPCLILLIIYYYLPLCGLKIAFEKFIPSRGLFGAQEYVGFKWFQYLFKMEDFKLAIRNTLTIAFWKLVLTMLVSIIFAVLINEMRRPAIKRTVQTVVYLPHFISWVILAGVFVDLLSPTEGVVNRLITAFGGKPVYFLGSNKWFQSTLIVTDIWKEFGFGTIVYLAAITSIDQGLYEASIIDGANKFRQIWHVTLPGLINIITLMALLNIGAILNGNFDQVYNMYSPQVYNSGDILDTLVYRIGMVDFNFSLATAVGVFKSLVSMILISASYFAAWKFADYRIF
jgi:putative aldouronate transport system permease protein